MREPAWLGTPSVQKRSLTATGTPPSGASGATAGGSAAAGPHVNAFSSSATARVRWAPFAPPRVVALAPPRPPPPAPPRPSGAARRGRGEARGVRHAGAGPGLG